MTGAVSTPVAEENVEQARAWDGDEGSFWAAHPDAFDDSVRDHHARLFDAAGITPGERVLDVGCGTGQTTRDAARRAGEEGHVVGVDLSSAMLDVARHRVSSEPGLPPVELLKADAQVHPFAPSSFDLVLSRAGAMFFGDPRAAFANLARATRPGGRLCLLAWQPLERNEWIRTVLGTLAAGRDLPGPPPDAPGPFALSDPDRVRDLLTSAGWRDVALTDSSEQMYFGATADDALALVSGLMAWLLAGLDDDARGQALAALRTSLEAHVGPRGVSYSSAAWIITAHR